MDSLFGKTLYLKRHMAAGWFMATTAIVALTMSVYNSFSNGAIGDSLQNLPPALQKLAGSAVSFKTVGGYISQQIFTLRMPVLMTILAIAVLVGLTAGDEEKGLVETQLALPLSRSKLLGNKLLAGISVVLLASLGSLLGIQVGLWLTGHSYNVFAVLPYLFNCLMVALGYGLVGFAAAGLTGRRGVALGAASSLAFLGFLVNSMAPSVSLFATLDHATLFHYYRTSGGFDGGNLLVLAIVDIFLVLVGFVGFNRRDIRAR